MFQGRFALDLLGPGISGKKKEHKDQLFGSGDRPVGWGSSTRRGGGRKVRALPRKFVFLGFRREEEFRMSREFCPDVPDPWGYSKSLCTKSSCENPQKKSQKGLHGPVGPECQHLKVSKSRGTKRDKLKGTNGAFFCRFLLIFADSWKL